MTSNKILYTSSDIRKTIIDILGKSKGRRVVITAFVGDGAEAYLPNPKGIELVCWLKAGGTNPEAIRKLIKNGVKVYFAEALHMKVYWTEDCGVVISSANLSTNALGSGNLREIGVLLPSAHFDIKKVIQRIKPKKVTKKELDQLETAHRAYYKINKYRRVKTVASSFEEWMEEPLRSEWRIGYVEEGEGITSLATKKILKAQYAISDFETFIGCPSNTYQENDWVLNFNLKKEIPTNIGWLYVDFVAKIQKSDKVYDPKYSCQAVQVWSINRYPAPPFKIDARFKRALTIALQKFGVEKFKNTDPYKPSKILIELISKNY